MGCRNAEACFGSRDSIQWLALISFMLGHWLLSLSKQDERKSIHYQLVMVI